MDGPAPGEERITFEFRDGNETPEQGLWRNEVEALVHREIARIPPLLRHALVLREVTQLPMPEVREELGIAIAAAKSRLLRARHELRSRLEKYAGLMDAA